MKKLLLIFFSLPILLLSGVAYGGSTTVVVTDKIPGANCVWDSTTEDRNGTKMTKPGSNDIEYRRYKCTIPNGGFNGVLLILGSLVRYFAYIVSLIGVFMIVFSGVQMSLSGADQHMKEEAKKRIFAIISGLVLLFLVGWILSTVAPWIFN